MPKIVVGHRVAKLMFFLNMTSINEDEMYMRRCLQLAQNGWKHAKPNPIVGAVLVSGGRIIGEGYHQRYGEGHAEVNCFASVRPEDEPLLSSATLYVSLEPCSHYGKTPPCADLIVRKGVRRVVVGCVDPFPKVSGRGIRKLRDAGIEVSVGVLERECLWLNKRFITFNTLHRPYIILKWAQTSNGFIDDDGKPLRLSNDFTRMLVHKLRAECDAILVGHTTDQREHPRLDVRYWSGDNPRRFVLSADTSIDDVISECCQENRQSLLVEGGYRTLMSFIERGLWDEIRVETAPISVAKGTPAPALPQQVSLMEEDSYDNNHIVWYRRSTPLFYSEIMGNYGKE